MNYVNSRIAEGIRGGDPGKVLDIGCGVGGSMLYLAAKTSAQITGVTISPHQAQTGQKLMEAAGCSDRCSIIPGDFLNMEMVRRLSPPFDAAYAIESFLHMPGAEGFFEQAARLLAPGAPLIICDDFLAVDGNRSDRNRKRSRLIRRFTRGWQVHSLYTPSDLEAVAKTWGFQLTSRDDLTPFLELNRPRDLFIRILVGLLGWLPLRSPFWNNLLGGDSLQRLLLRGDLRYLLFYFKKT